MKLTAALVTVMFAASSSAAELSPKLLRVIGADARMVTGADLERQSNSPLKSEFSSNLLPGSTYKVLWIDYDTTNGPTTLTVVIGAVPAPDPGTPAPEFTALDANTRISGDPETIREAQRRWSTEQPFSPMAAEARRLSESYDNWFLVRKPFSVPTTASLSKYRQDLIDAVEEVSGGIRFGALNEVHLEAVFRNPEDASAVATLARWLPAILQLEQAPAARGFLLDAIEDFTTHADGQRAWISLRIPDDKVRSLIEAHHLTLIESAEGR